MSNYMRSATGAEVTAASPIAKFFWAKLVRFE